jgi:hypothetical protein
LGPIEPIQGLPEIDDMDAVTLSKDEILHLWVPTASLVAEVDPSFEQFVQFNLLHISASVRFTAC